jgi:hypothetical protein
MSAPRDLVEWFAQCHAMGGLPLEALAVANRLEDRMLKLKIWKTIIRALNDLPAEYTGNVLIRFDIHNGTVGRVAVAVGEEAGE